MPVLFTPDKTKPEWERAKDALEVLLNTFTVEQVEDLAVQMSDPDFKKSIKWKIFKSQIMK